MGIIKVKSHSTKDKDQDIRPRLDMFILFSLVFEFMHD